jgi:hypothetical protein
MDKFFYKKDGKVYGPVLKSELFNDSDVSIDTMICLSDNDINRDINWFPYKILFECVGNKEEKKKFKNYDSSNIGGILFIISFLGLLFSFGIDTSNDGVVNLSMISDRLVLFIFFGFLFIGSLLMIFSGGRNFNDINWFGILKFFGVIILVLVIFVNIIYLYLAMKICFFILMCIVYKLFL